MMLFLHEIDSWICKVNGPVDDGPDSFVFFLFLSLLSRPLQLGHSGLFSLSSPKPRNAPPGPIGAVETAYSETSIGSWAGASYCR